MGKSSTSIGMSDVLTYATELERHSGGKVSLALWPKPYGGSHQWEVSAMLAYPILDGPARTGNAMHVASWPDREHKQLEGLMYHLIHLLDKDYTAAFEQSEYPTA